MPRIEAPGVASISKGERSPSGGARRTGWSAIWHRLREFSGLERESTYFWPRWWVLRAVGVVYVYIFWGVLEEGQALLGPRGLVPLDQYFAALLKLVPGKLAAFFSAPSLFWAGTSPGMIAAVGWAGMMGAVALVLNLWPRMALFVCWLAFLSCVTTWGEFSPAQLDRLMLEVAVLCIPFAPAGFRPGLGVHSPPRPIALFMMKWLLLRVMVMSGLVKILSEDVHWRNFTAMDVMYETSPSPTVLGYWVHQLPPAYHRFEVVFTFAAELVAPLLAVFGGRRARWVAFFLWTALQVGIQLTCNFGWLNTAAAGLGLLLLDDQMIRSAADRFRWARLRAFFADPVGAAPRPRGPAWQTYGLRAVLGVHFALTLFYFAKACGFPVETDSPRVIQKAVGAFAEFRSANGYYLYANFEKAHYQVDFEGSNDGGKTWRTYEYKTVPQQVDQMPPFVAPRFARFDTTLQIQSSRPGKDSMVFPLTAAHLLACNPEILERFVQNPFPDRDPTVVRMRQYTLSFTDPATLRRTGRYWHKEDIADFLPAMYVNAEGRIVSFNLASADAALQAGNFSAALREYEAQFALGNLEAGYRIADIYLRGLGVREQPRKVFEMFSDLAQRGEVKGVHNLGLCYEHGVGVSIDLAQAEAAYRRAAERGNLASFYALGMLAATDRLSPKNDVQGLAWLIEARERATSDEPFAKFVREDQPAHAQRLIQRMSPDDVAKARELAQRP